MSFTSPAPLSLNMQPTLFHSHLSNQVGGFKGNPNANTSHHVPIENQRPNQQQSSATIQQQHQPLTQRGLLKGVNSALDNKENAPIARSTRSRAAGLLTLGQSAGSSVTTAAAVSAAPNATTLNQKPRRVLQEIKADNSLPSAPHANSNSALSNLLPTSRRAHLPSTLSLLTTTSSSASSVRLNSSSTSALSSTTTSSLTSAPLSQIPSLATLSREAEQAAAKAASANSLLTATAQAVLGTNGSVFVPSSTSSSSSSSLLPPSGSYIAAPACFTSSALSSFCGIASQIAASEATQQVEQVAEVASSDNNNHRHNKSEGMDDAMMSALQQSTYSAFSAHTVNSTTTFKTSESASTTCMVDDYVHTSMVSHNYESIVLTTTTCDSIAQTITTTTVPTIQVYADPIEIEAEPEPEMEKNVGPVSNDDNHCGMDLSSPQVPVQDKENVASMNTDIAAVIPSSPSPPSILSASIPSSSSHLWCSEYTTDILDYWFETELRYQPPAHYLSAQPDLNSKMREILIDWLHEVVLRFRLHSESLFLAVQLLDRFLQRKAVHRRKLQLVGCCALFLASKYEEIYIPEIKDFIIISDNAYSREHILQMEAIMLNTLGFNLTQVSSLHFLQLFLALPSVNLSHPTTQGEACAQMLAAYLCELTLQFVNFLQFRPSTIAASVVYLVQHQRWIDSGNHANDFKWDEELVSVTRHSAVDLTPCIDELYAHWSVLSSNAQPTPTTTTGTPTTPATSKCQAVFKKFAKERYGMVSHIILEKPDIIKHTTTAAAQ